jgi:thiamine-monophosphate kinase
LDREAQLIERIAKAVRPPRDRRTGAEGLKRLRLGIGDDGAVLASGGPRDWVLSCDASLDGVHFRVASTPPDSVGYKGLARAASDLAAMGAEPQFFLLTLALPADRTGKWLDGFLRGMGRAARELRIRLVGGDTTKSARVSVSITVIGEVGRGLAVRRSGARPGDVIYVSGALGRAALGLALIGAGRSSRSLAGLLKPHLYPKIPIALGAWLARHRLASAMMDLSDGLSTDLARLCQASGVGARLKVDEIPAVKIPEAAQAPGSSRLDARRLALHGGEDYQLLFTVSQRNRKRLRGAPGFAELTAIGEIKRGRRITLVDEQGRGTDIEPLGWDPFS